MVDSKFLKMTWNVTSAVFKTGRHLEFDGGQNFAKEQILEDDDAKTSRNFATEAIFKRKLNTSLQNFTSFS